MATDNLLEDEEYKKLLFSKAPELMKELDIIRSVAVGYLLETNINLEECKKRYKEDIKNDIIKYRKLTDEEQERKDKREFEEFKKESFDTVKNQCFEDDETIIKQLELNDYDPVKTLISINNIKVDKDNDTLFNLQINPYEFVNELILNSSKLDYKIYDNIPDELLNSVNNYLTICITKYKQFSKRNRYGKLYDVIKSYFSDDDNIKDNLVIYRILSSDSHFAIITLSNYRSEVTDSVLVNKAATALLRQYDYKDNEFYNGICLFMNNIKL